MTKKNIRYHNEAQAELGKILRFAGRKHGLWQVFRDFVAMSAIAISNAVDKSAYEEREADYLAMVARYSREELDELSRGLACIVMGLEDGPDDFLGALYMSLELGDAWKGQFFTPYQVSYLMAAMTVGDGTQREIDRKGYVSVSDPAIGGGATAFFKVVVAFLCFLCGLWNGHILSFRIQHDSAHRRPVACRS